MENDGKDVSYMVDFCNFLGHAVALEGHLKNSFALAKNESEKKLILEMYEMIRRKRSKQMYAVVKEGRLPFYCITKHLAGMAETSKELATRLLESGKQKEAEELLNDSNTYDALILELNAWGNK